MTASVPKCEYISRPNLSPGWGCCQCRTYNGVARPACKHCDHPRCAPLPTEQEAPRAKEGFNADLARVRAAKVVEEWNRQTRGELGRIWSLGDLTTDIAHEIRRAWAEGLPQ